MKYLKKKNLIQSYEIIFITEYPWNFFFSNDHLKFYIRYCFVKKFIKIYFTSHVKCAKNN